MLAREKTRVVWSLAIGAFCASAILGWGYRKARIANSRLPALVEQCKGSHAGPSGSVPSAVAVPLNAMEKRGMFEIANGEKLSGSSEADAAKVHEGGEDSNALRSADTRAPFAKA